MAGMWERVGRWLSPDEPASSVADEDLQLDAHHVLTRWQVGVEFAFVDVREAAEVAATGCLPAAVRLPVGQVEARASELPRDVVVLFYCASGTRSLRAARRLRALGHPAAFSLEGGLPAWTRAGGEVEPS